MATERLTLKDPSRFKDPAGLTWERLPTDGLVTDRVWTVGLDPTAPDRVLAASPAGGMHMLLPAPPAGAAGSTAGSQ